MERNEIIYEPNWNDKSYSYNSITFEEVFRSENNKQAIFKEKGGEHYEVYSFNKVPEFRGGAAQWGAYAWTTKSLERAYEILKTKESNGI